MRQASHPVLVIGAGLAGSEAALRIASLGIPVELCEMRPGRMTEAHRTEKCAELVCSNSFGSVNPHSASAILKDELGILDAQVLAMARAHGVPAGASLAVDRELFSRAVSEAVDSHPHIFRRPGEIKELPADRIVVMATGPLTTPDLAKALGEKLGGTSLYFYDAISPIVSTDSLDLSQMFFANRWDKGETKDFLNIPLTKEQYDELVQDLLTGDVVLPHNFEEEKYFEACMPIEALASRGPKTLSFGPMKPVGLHDPKTGKRAHAVIQLRMENRFGTAYNLVGFQTKLKYKEQERIFRKLPGMTNAEFLRLGSMHRNTFLDSPRVLQPTLQLRCDSRIFIAGQLTGTEGYLESTATGWIAGNNAARLWRGLEPVVPPATTMLGSLLRAITDETKENFQPLNSNLGVLPPLPIPTRDKKARNAQYSARSVIAMKEWIGKKEETSVSSDSTPAHVVVTDPERPGPTVS